MRRTSRGVGLLGAVERWVMVVLLALPLVLVWRLWAPNAADRHVMAHGDFVEYFYPMRRFVAEEWKAGRLPLWNPYVFGGTPSLADPQNAALYPPAWLSALVPPWPPLPFEVLQAEAVLHLGLAGVFTFLYARRHLPLMGAFVAATVFALGGYLTSYPPLQLAVLETATWLPLVLLGLDRLIEHGRLNAGRVAMAAAPLVLALLAGHPQTFLFIGYVAVAYFAVQAYGRLAWAEAARRFGAWAAAAALLGAAQWLPTVELILLGPRAVLPYEVAGTGFQWRDLIHIVLPGAFGPWSPLYVGAATLALAAVGVWDGGRRVWFWVGAALAAVALSLGARGGLYWVAYHALPGFSLFRQQERMALVWSFALAMLAGHGLAALLGTTAGRGAGRVGRWTLGAAGGLGALAMGLVVVMGVGAAGPGGRIATWAAGAAYSALVLALAAPLLVRVRRGGGVAVGAVALLVVVDLLSTSGRALTEPPPAGGYLASNEIVWTIQADRDGWFRVSSEGRLPPGGGNGAIVVGAPDVVGNSPLHLARYDALLADVPELVWWRLLGVRYVLSERELTHGALSELESVGEARLYRLAGSQPRAWIVPAVRVVESAAAERRALTEPGFDPAVVAVTADAAAAGLGLPAVGRAMEDASVEVTAVTPAYLRIGARTEAPGVLVVAEAYAPGWRAWVDGRAAPAFAVDGLLRGVPVPAGESRVEMRYMPWTVAVGLAVSLLTAVGLALAMGRGRWVGG